MRGFEVRATVRDLVVFDHDQAGDEEHDAYVIERGVYICTLLLLSAGVCWLDEENALRDEQQTRGVQERMC